MSENLVFVCNRFMGGLGELGIGVPEAVELKSTEDGLLVVSEVKAYLSYDPDPPTGRSVKSSDGRDLMEIEIQGLKIRWPASD